jgi:hypothetical protein
LTKPEAINESFPPVASYPPPDPFQVAAIHRYARTQVDPAFADEAVDMLFGTSLSALALGLGLGT